MWDNASTLVWADAVPDVAGVPATIGFQEETVLGADAPKADSKDVSGAASAVNWYAIDYAASMYSLTHTGPANQPVGTTVTSTYKAVDQNGEPIADLDVTFFRSGPDDLQDGDGNSVRTTNSQGQANYVYQGAKAGTAKVTAVVREPSVVTNEGDLIPQGEKSDSVTFVNAPLPGQPVAITATLAGANNGPRADVLKVSTTTKAAGATVKLYKVINGRRVLVATKSLASTGKVNFRVKDRNRNRITKYVAVVSATSKTKADTSNIKGVR